METKRKQEKSDSFTLRLSFAGLCAFVPRGENLDRIERMDVLLVKPVYFGPYVEPHSSILRFDLKNLPGNGQNSALGTTQGFWNLDDEDLEVFTIDRATGQSEPLTGRIELCGGRKAEDKPREDKHTEVRLRGQDLKEQEADFAWLPEISKSLDERAGKINVRILDAVNPSYALSARFFIHCGAFSSHSIGRYLSDYVVAQFVPPIQPGKPFAQALAHWAGCDIEVDSGCDILIRASRFDQRAAPREIILRASPGETLTVQVSNLCCGYTAQETQGIPDFNPDRDYAHFYRLSAHFDALESEFPILPIPVAVSYQASTRSTRSTGGLNPIRCSGTRFDPVSLGVDFDSLPAEGETFIARLQEIEEKERRRHGILGE